MESREYIIEIITESVTKHSEILMRSIKEQFPNLRVDIDDNDYGRPRYHIREDVCDGKKQYTLEFNQGYYISKTLYDYWNLDCPKILPELERDIGHVRADLTKIYHTLREESTCIVGDEDKNTLSDGDIEHNNSKLMVIAKDVINEWNDRLTGAHNKFTIGGTHNDVRDSEYRILCVHYPVPGHVIIYIDVDKYIQRVNENFRLGEREQKLREIIYTEIQDVVRFYDTWN